jgi:hypothetical protein
MGQRDGAAAGAVRVYRAVSGPEIARSWSAPVRQRAGSRCPWDRSGRLRVCCGHRQPRVWQEGEVIDLGTLGGASTAPLLASMNEVRWLDGARLNLVLPMHLSGITAVNGGSALRHVFSNGDAPDAQGFANLVARTCSLAGRAASRASRQRDVHRRREHHPGRVLRTLGRDQPVGSARELLRAARGASGCPADAS